MTTRQAKKAEQLLRDASVVAFPLPCICELVWVLGRSYSFQRADIVRVLETLCAAPNVAVDRAAVDAGLAVLNAGGDFADGVIAQQGQWLGGETFVSFDRKAVAILESRGIEAKLIA